MKLNKLLMTSRICEVRKSLFCATLPFLLSTTGAYAQMMGGPPPNMNLHGAPSSIPSQPASTTGTTINSAPSSTSGQGSKAACDQQLGSCNKTSNETLSTLMAECGKHTSPDLKRRCETYVQNLSKTWFETCRIGHGYCIAALGIKSGETQMSAGPTCWDWMQTVDKHRKDMLIAAGKGALASTADAISSIVAVTTRPAHGTPLPDSPPDGSMGGPNQTADGFKSQLEDLAIKFGSAREECSRACQRPCP